MKTSCIHLYFLMPTLTTLALAACGRPTPEDIEIGSTTNPSGPEDPTDPTDNPTTGGGYEGCLYNPESGFTGIQHQCGGSGFAKIRFNVVGAGSANGPQSFSVGIPFGADFADDTYEKPKVMACCAPPFDDEADMIFQPHYKACFHDLVENGCRSLWVQLNNAKEEAPALAGPQIQSLADWLADHQQECYDEFWVASGAEAWAPQTIFDYFFLNHVWELPTSAETNNIEDIEFEFSTGSVNNIFVPAVQDQLTCQSQKDNNDVTFLVGEPSDGTVSELYYGDAILSGPGTPPFDGSSEFTSASTSCPDCSMISTRLTVNEDAVQIHSMVLDTDGATVVTDATASMTVDRARIALYKPVAATAVGSLYFEIPAGGAMFVVSADAGGTPFLETTFNSKTIGLEMSSSPVSPPAWTVDPISLTYTDANLDAWTLETGTLYFNP